MHGLLKFRFCLLIFIYPWILLAPTRKNRISYFTTSIHIIETHPCLPQPGESLKSAPSYLVGTFFLNVLHEHCPLTCLHQLGERLAII